MKQDRKSICTLEHLIILWTAREMNNWDLNQIKPEILLEAPMIKFVMRSPSALERTIIGKVDCRSGKGWAWSSQQ